MKTIVFDLGGVLINLDKQRCIHAFQKLGASRVAEYVEQQRTQDLFLDAEKGIINTETFAEAVLKLQPCEATSQQIIEAWNLLIADVPAEKIAWLKHLRKQYRLILLSNTNEMHIQRCENAFMRCEGKTMESYFDRCYYSCRMHMIKPSSQIFEAMIQDADIVPEDTLFIDDTASNCETARRMGFHVIHAPQGNEWITILSQGDKDINLAPLDIPRPCAATIGFFDGVHTGHRYLIEKLKEEARKRNIESAVITFRHHPKAVLQPQNAPTLLTTTDEKIAQLLSTGIDRVFVLDFTPRLAALTAKEFMTEVLAKQYHVELLLIGHDNRFGKNRAEGFDDYVRYGKALGMEVCNADAHIENNKAVSSSMVRRSIEAGDMQLACKALGRPYTLAGKVVAGFQKGRQLGFPTANLDMTNLQQLVPAKGVYATTVRIEGLSQTYMAMTSVGTRPTFGGESLTVETYIFDLQQDLYDRMMWVSFEHRLRDEERFNSVNDLIEQMKRDAENTTKLLKDKITNA